MKKSHLFCATALALFAASARPSFAEIAFPEFNIKADAEQTTNTMMPLYQKWSQDNVSSEKQKAEARNVLAHGAASYNRQQFKFETMLRAWSVAHWNELSDDDKHACMLSGPKNSYLLLESCMRISLHQVEEIPEPPLD